MNGFNTPLSTAAGLLCLLLAQDVTANERLKVELFVDSRQLAGPWSSLAATHPDLDLTVYDLAAPKVLAAQLGAGLPKDPEAAKQIAQKRINDQKGQLAERLRSAYAGLSRAMALGLNRTPALVVNEEAILYGSADIDEALNRYRQWQEHRQP